MQDQTVSVEMDLDSSVMLAEGRITMTQQNGYAVSEKLQRQAKGADSVYEAALSYMEAYEDLLLELADDGYPPNFPEKLERGREAESRLHYLATACALYLRESPEAKRDVERRISPSRRQSKNGKKEKR
jgi:hypothetical protein